MSGVLGEKRVLITGATGGVGPGRGASFSACARACSGGRGGTALAGERAAGRTADGSGRSGHAGRRGDGSAGVGGTARRHRRRVHLMGGFAMDGSVEATKSGDVGPHDGDQRAVGVPVVPRGAAVDAQGWRRAAAGRGFARGSEGAPGGAAYGGTRKRRLHALVLNPGGGAAAEGDHGECRAARYHRHGGQPGRDAERRLREMGRAGSHRRHSRLAGLGSVGGNQRGADSDLRTIVKPRARI